MSERLNDLRDRLLSVEAKIERIEARQPAPDPLGDSFHLGRVGGSGNPRTLAKLNRQRARSLDRTIDAAVELGPLYRERERLARLIEDEESGRAERKRQAKADRAARVRAAKVGDTVIDSAFGEAKVIRVNRKSLTIQTPSGYREARAFSLILDVVKEAG